MRALPAVFMLAGYLTIAPVAHAEDPLQATQAMIQQQIQAFLHNDPATAYSFAAPGIKALFPDKDAFFAMVKKSYEPVYHPGNYAFGRNKSIDDGAVVYQEVLITGTDGKDWSAIYQVTRQPDGSYKINGVQIVPNTTSQGI
ncbi:DUF4864 domain-containing protein [Neorhizobium sp. P12A]|uniref:DUF4864 domain-containing protein n=1 Tax=Rhizobium/Agrobacterium group TaxID=227290 RepID=UPI00104DCBD1|nr:MULTISPECIES: DUF4864 domain-containing protein [Rhizobium/Agrobacterium group]KAA0694525.1 DUF4864 domain-containing protein [Neorhizobium sp. P12A]TCR85319.1 uncharacterized protein DUF4864 [Rhizobium sp. BK376]